MRHYNSLRCKLFIHSFAKRAGNRKNEIKRETNSEDEVLAGVEKEE